MTLTPREYLHQRFGPKDRRWIDSMTEERCWEVSWSLTLSGIVGIKAFKQEGGEHPIYHLEVEDLHPLPDVPGEYENWR